VAAEYEVNIKINSQEIERELGKIDRTVAKIGKPKGGGSRRKPGIAGLLPSSEELRAAEKGIVQLTAKTKNIQSIQDKFSERRTRALARSNALNEKDLRLNRQLTAEARTRLRLLSQAGAKGFDGTRPQGRQLANDINARAKAQEKRAKLANKINEMEAKGLNVAKLRKQLGKATTAQANSQFASAEKEFRLLRKTIELEESKLRILRAQTSERRFASSPIRGTPTMMGSPAQIAAAARAGGAVSPIGGRIDIPGSPAFLAGQQIPGLKAGQVFGPSFPTGGASSPVRGGFNFPGSPIALAGETVSRTPFGPSFPTGGAASPVRGGFNFPGSPIALAGAIASNVPFGPSFPTGGAASPVRGGLNFPGSPIAVAEANRIARLNAGLTGQSSPIRGGIFQKGSPNQKRFEGVALGAGFPALFGGGAGSIIGGGLGGFTGSFGAQIALSAIGQQIDQFVASVAAVGTALTSASGTVEMFREKNLFSSDAVKEHAFQLEEQGKMQELATLLTKDLASQIGVNAVKNFQELGGEVKEFLGTINQLFLAVQGFVAGPLAKLLGAINTVLGGVSTEMQFKNLRGSLTGDAAAEFERIFLEARGTRDLTGRDLRTAQRKDLPTTVPGLPTTAAMQRALQDPRTAALRQTLDVTGQTTLDDTLGGNTAVKAAQRLLESSQRRISILKLEAEEIKKITNFKNKIAAAELVSDKRAVARLTRDQELAKLKSNEDKAIARINPKLTEAQQALEKTNIEARGLAQAAEIRAQFERDIAAIVKDEQNEAYKQQAKLLKANFDLQQKELKKAQDLAKSFGDTIKDGFVDSIKAAADETQRLSDALANMLNRLSDQLLNLAANLAFYGNAQGNLQQGQGLFGTILGSVASIFNPYGSLMAPGGRYEGQSGPLAPTPPPLPALANGGIAMAGQAHIVGERGPELFVPRRTGTVVPNNAMGGANVVVNVDASGSSAQGDGQQAKALGQAIGVAVQAELIKQKRPGGLLS
jgi:hypothetical protein